MKELFKTFLGYDLKEGIYDFIKDHNDPFVENYEEISKDFDGKISVETMVLSNLCEVLVPKYSTVLDVGCGRCYILNNFLFMEERVGLDVSKNELHFVPKNSDIMKIRAFGENMPFTNSYFDVVLCLDVLEHVRDVERLAFELNRVLRIGGMLLLACPWKQDLSVYDSDEYKKNYKQYRYKHLRSIDYKMIEDLFPRFNLEAYTFITVQSEFHTIKPYSIRFMKLVKQSGQNSPMEL